MEKHINIFLRESERLRPGYIESLKTSSRDKTISLLLKEFTKMPPFIEKLYSIVSGTYYHLEDQKMMDFIPGYLLVHLDEYKEALQTQNTILQNYPKDEFFPLLRNYSSDFISINSSTNEIHHILHDDEPHLLHKNPQDFISTLIENYLHGVYFLDDDGYLDYDEELEMEIGKKVNPDVPYWQE